MCSSHVLDLTHKDESSKKTLVTAITPENLVRQMLASEKAWSVVTGFARQVIEELRKEEKKRREQRIDAGCQAVE